MFGYVRLPEDKTGCDIGEEYINGSTDGISRCYFYENPLDAIYPGISAIYALVEIVGHVHYGNNTLYEVWTTKAIIIKHMTEQELRHSIPDGIMMTDSGNIFSFKNGMYHSYNDKPAASRYLITGELSEQRWYTDGMLDRKNGPAIIKPGWWRKWCQNGILHRNDDKPAIIYDNMRQEWYHFGRHHRDNNKPAVMDVGTQQWFKDGEEYSPSNKEYIMMNLKDWYYIESDEKSSGSKRRRYKK
jgi:hypothetical protein